MSLGRAVKFVGTATTATALAGFTGYATYTWAHMFMPFKTAALAGVALGFLPGLALNKVLTNAYRKHERWANEVGFSTGPLLTRTLFSSAQRSSSASARPRSSGSKRICQSSRGRTRRAASRRRRTMSWSESLAVGAGPCWRCVRSARST